MERLIPVDLSKTKALALAVLHDVIQVKTGMRLFLALVVGMQVSCAANDGTYTRATGNLDSSRTAMRQTDPGEAGPDGFGDRRETPAAPAEAATSDYRLAPRDLIEVEVFNQPDLATSQRLTENGEIRLPLIGRVELSGLTLRQAEARVEAMYRDGGFIIQPQVILSLKEYSDRFVSIFGQVRDPSRVPFPPETNTIGIIEAITLAGGFTRIARTDEVQVTRRNSSGVEERIIIDVSAFLKTRSSNAQEFQLMPGDRVFVPERVF